MDQRTGMDAAAQEQDETTAKKEKQRAAYEEHNKRRDEMYFRFQGMEEDWNPNCPCDHESSSSRAVHFRCPWLWEGSRGSFEDTTSIPAMRFTDDPPANIQDRSLSWSLQIFSIKVAAATGGLRWPLHVYGIVAARDIKDYNRNIIFARPRENCQIITQEDPYLALTGPTRAIVLCFDPGEFEVLLKVKGGTESEDRDLSFLITTMRTSRTYSGDYTSKRSVLQLACREIPNSVEATISVQLVDGGWPHGFRGLFTASTTAGAVVEDDERKVLLLAFGDGDDQPSLPVADDGMIKLSRRVVSVEFSDTEKLGISVEARPVVERVDDQAAIRDDVFLKPEKSGRSYGVLNVRSCKMQVTVAWSLVPDYW